ncbi:TPA: YadA-like family protein [Mannheimia haemolytica]
MNSIYKIVFNKATGTYQAVAEFAKSHTRAGGVVGSKPASRSRSILAALPLSLLALSVGEAMTIDNNLSKYIKIYTNGSSLTDASATNDKAIAVGPNAKANAPNTVVIGADADAAEQHGAVIIGKGAKSGKFGRENYVSHYHYENPLSTYPVVHGVLGKILTSSTSQQAVESSVVAIGTDTEVKGGGVAVGHGAISTVGNGNRGLGVAVGAASRSIDGGVAVGPGAESIGLNTVAVGRQAVAKGKASQAYGATSAAEGVKTIAMGQSAHAKGDRSIAIGASGGNSTEKYDANTNTMAEAEDSIAFGTHTRTGQGANKAIAIGKNTEVAKNAISGVAIGDTAKTSKTNGIALGNTAKAEGVTSTAIGTTAKASRSGAQAIGFVATADGLNSQAIGTAAMAVKRGAMAVGLDAKAEGVKSQAIGVNAIAKGLHAQAIGTDARALAADATAVGHLASAKGESAAAFGHMAKADKQHATATGAFAKAQAKDATAVGAHARVTKEAIHGSALGAFSRVTTKDGVALGAHSLADRQHLTDAQVAAVAKAAENKVYSPLTQTAINNTTLPELGIEGETQEKLKAFNEGIKNTVKGEYGAVSVGTSTSTRQIINVAAGSEDSDAVNVAQLKALAGTPIIFEADEGGKVVVNLGDLLPVKGKENGGIKTTAKINNSLEIEVKPNTDKGIEVTAQGVGVKLKEDKDGTKNPLTVSNEGLNLNIDDNTLEVEGDNGSKKLKVKLKDSGGLKADESKQGITVNVDNKTIEINSEGQVQAKTTIVTDDNDDGIVEALDPNALVTAEEVANAIGEAGFILTHSASAGEAEGDEDEIIRAGDKVTLDAGQNIKLKQEAGKISIATKDHATFSSVTSDIVKLGDTGPQLRNGDDGYSIKVTANDGESPIKISNIAKGEANNDAVNVEQLTEAKAKYFADEDSTPPEKDGATNTATNKENAKALDQGVIGIKGGKTGDNDEDKNITTTINTAENTLQVALNPDVKGLTSIQFAEGEGVKVGDDVTFATENATAVGRGAVAFGEDTSAFGNSALAIAPGAQALGARAKAWGIDAQALGPNAQAIANNAQAIGANSRVIADGGVALGAYSIADRVATQDPITYNQNANVEFGEVYTPVPDGVSSPAAQLANQAIKDTVKGTLGAVSVGDDENTRQIINVAAGSEDTDAVNVAQLRALSELPMSFGADFGESVDRRLGEELTIRGFDKSIYTVTNDRDQAIEIAVQANEAMGVQITEGGVATKIEKSKNNALQFGDKGGLELNIDTSTLAVEPEADKLASKKLKVNLKDKGGLATEGDTGIFVNVDDATIKITPEGKVAAKTADLTAAPEGLVKINGGDNGDALVTANTVMNAINNSGFKLTHSQSEGEATGTTDQLIKAGETVTIDAGKNIKLNQQEGKITVSTKDDVSFNTVNAKQKITVGDATDGKVALTIASEKGRDNKNTITGLTDNLKRVGRDDIKVTFPSDLYDVSSNNKDYAGKAEVLSRAATVSDVLSSGFNLQANSEDKDFVRAYDTIDFIDGQFSSVVIKNKTDENKSTIQINVDAQALVEGAQLPVVYTDAEGNKLTKKADGSFVNKEGQKVDPADVIASINNGKGSTTEPTNLANVAGNLIPTYNVGDMIVGPNHKLTDTPILDATKGQEAPQGLDLANMYNNAATVGDILNAGWNLQGNGEEVDFVKAYDTVNFVNGTGTTAVAKASEDGKTSTVQYDVNVDDETITTKQDPKDPNKTVITAKTAQLKTNPQGSNEAGKVTVEEGDKNALITAGDVANAINNSGFTLKANGKDGKLVKAGDAVSINEGDNIEVTHDKDGNIKISGKKDVDLTTAVFTDEGGNRTGVGGSGVFIVPNGVDPKTQPNDIVTLTVNGLNNGGNSITNVKSNLVDNDIVTEVPAQNRKDSLAGKVNNAATVGDVLNAGWNLQNNGQPVDVVSHADTVNFINGRGTTVVTDNDPATGTTTIKVDSPIAYVGGNKADATDTSTPSNTVKLYGKDNSPVQVTNIASGVRDALVEKAGNNILDKDVANAIKTASGDTLNNAVNVGDLKATINDTITTVSTNAYGLKDKAGKEFKQNLGSTVQITGDDNINTEVVEVTDKDGQKGHALKVSLNPTLEIGAKDGKDGKDGVDGKLGINGKDGSAIVLNGKDGSIGLNGKDGKDGLTFKAADGAQGVDGRDGANGLPGKNGQTRIVYETKDKDGSTKTQEVANLDDGLIFTGNDGTLNRHKLNSVVKIVGEGVNAIESGKFESATGNINVKANGTDALEIQLSKDIDLTKGGSITIGDTVLTDKGLTIIDGPSVTKDGINAGGKKITNVADGEDDTDVVNVKQLKGARTTVTSSDNSISVVDLNNGQDGKNLAYDIKVDSQALVESAQLPVVYTDAEGNKLTLKNGKFIGKDGKEVDPADVIVSINNGKGSTTEPTNLANVAGSLTPTYNVGDMIVGPNGRLTTNPIFDATKEQAAPQGQQLANIYNNAATVGDVLNAGFNLQANGKAADFVKAYDTVNFANGTGTTVVVDNTDGKTSTIKVDVNVDDETITTKQDPKDPTKTVITAKTTKLNTNPQGGNEAGKVTVEGNQGDALVTAKTVADAINNSGFTLKANGEDGKLVKAGDTISINQGDNIKVTQDENGNLTVATKQDVAFETVKVGDTLKVGDVIINQDGINAGNQKVTNVADGNISEGSKDAVNGGQIHQLKADLTKGINAAKTEVEGTGFAEVTPRQGNQGQTIYTVNVAKAAPATVDAKGKLSIEEAEGKKVLSAADTINAINNSGFTLKANGEDGKLVKAGDAVSINQGNNTRVFQDENGNITVETKDDVAFETVKVGDVLKVGNITITPDGISAAGTKVTNVADGTNNQDAVNVSQLNKAKAAATTEVKAGDNISVAKSKGDKDQDVYTISAKDRSAKVVAKAQGLIAVETGDTTDIDGAQTTSYTVDLTDKAKEDIAKGVKALDKVDSQGLTFKADNGSTDARKLGDTLNVKGDNKNITTKATGDAIEVQLKSDITVDSVTAGNSKLDTTGLTINAATPANTVSLTAQGLNNGGQRITNVAPGVKDTDAVNVSQLKGAVNYLDNKINRHNRKLRAGIAGANAAAGLPQVYIPGKSMIAASVGTFKGQNALAVGYSRSSDNGKLILKLQGNANTSGEFGGSMGVGYQW